MTTGSLGAAALVEDAAASGAGRPSFGGSPSVLPATAAPSQLLTDEWVSTTIRRSNAQDRQPSRGTTALGT